MKFYRQGFVGWIAILFYATFGGQLFADIFQWRYVDPSDVTQGTEASAVLCPDGAGVEAAPDADLYSLDLTKAYLRGADLSSIFAYGVTLVDADLSNANLFSAYLNGADL